MQRLHSEENSPSPVHTPVQGFMTSVPYSASACRQGSARTSLPNQRERSDPLGISARPSPNQIKGTLSFDLASWRRPHRHSHMLHVDSKVSEERALSDPLAEQIGHTDHKRIRSSADSNSLLKTPSAFASAAPTERLPPSDSAIRN